MHEHDAIKPCTASMQLLHIQRKLLIYQPPCALRYNTFLKLFLVSQDCKVTHACNNVIRHSIAFVLARKMTFIGNT